MKQRTALALVIFLGSLVALAGENRFLGTIRSYGNVAATNVSTGTYTLADAGFQNIPFVIPSGSRVTLDCNAAARVLTDALTVTRDGGTNKGLRVAATTLLPTSVGANVTTYDGGNGVRVSTATIAVLSEALDGGVECDVWQRSGTE